MSGAYLGGGGEGSRNLGKRREPGTRGQEPKAIQVADSGAAAQEPHHGVLNVSASSPSDTRTGLIAEMGSQDDPWPRRKKIIEIIALILLVISAGAAAASAILTYVTSRQTIHFQAEFSGNETWTSYRNLQAEFEREFGSDYVYPSRNRQADRRYKLLNERLLMAADLLTFMNEINFGWNDPQWEDSFVYEFREHADYFLSDEFLRGSEGLMSEYCTYRAPVRRWLLNAYARHRSVSRIRNAEAECGRICRIRRGCT